LTTLLRSRIQRGSKMFFNKEKVRSSYVKPVSKESRAKRKAAIADYYVKYKKRCAMCVEGRDPALIDFVFAVDYFLPENHVYTKSEILDNLKGLLKQRFDIEYPE